MSVCTLLDHFIDSFLCFVPFEPPEVSAYFFYQGTIARVTSLVQLIITFGILFSPFLTPLVGFTQ